MMDIANVAASLIKSIRIQDILDMAIIAAMIFALLMWFKTRATRFVLTGVLLLGGIYLVARFFQLYLTIIVLQGFFAILLFVLVVIFQEDLRGFFERLAMLGNLRKEIRPLTELERVAGILAETAGNLAKKRIGALIVVQGDDPLDRHLKGGIELCGMISEPLLASIFDPHSAGHDGAVIVKDDRIVLFGCHLPLSVNIGRYENIGLRHTAALGLTERSDSLCIVVSEERGTISVADGRELTIVPNASALNEILEKFYIRFQPAPKKRPVWSWLRENTKEKVIALGLACILWVAFGHQRDIVRRDLIIPVEYKNIPQSWQMNDPQINEVKVIFQGPEQAFRLLDEKTLRLSLDLSSLTEKKREFTLTTEMINVPSNLYATDINPRAIRVYASKMIPANAAINVVTRNALPDHLALQKITPIPSSLRVLIDHRLKAEDLRLQTEPVDLSKIMYSLIMETNLAPATGISFPEGKAPVIRLNIRVKRK
ncbi:MAG TPA: diadenylate cyclase [Smithellaceae bacterium]|nr:diadenylate cyclase [Smithellaceae bacterium]